MIPCEEYLALYINGKIRLLHFMLPVLDADEMTVKEVQVLWRA